MIYEIQSRWTNQEMSNRNGAVLNLASLENMGGYIQEKARELGMEPRIFREWIQNAVFATPNLNHLNVNFVVIPLSCIFRNYYDENGDSGMKAVQKLCSPETKISKASVIVHIPDEPAEYERFKTAFENKELKGFSIFSTNINFCQESQMKKGIQRLKAIIQVRKANRFKIYLNCNVSRPIHFKSLRELLLQPEIPLEFIIVATNLIDPAIDAAKKDASKKKFFDFDKVSYLYSEIIKKYIPASVLSVVCAARSPPNLSDENLKNHLSIVYESISKINVYSQSVPENLIHHHSSTAIPELALAIGIRDFVKSFTSYIRFRQVLNDYGYSQTANANLGTYKKQQTTNQA